MEIETILAQLGQLIQARAAAVGDLERRLKALQMTIAVQASDFDEQIHLLRDLLTEHLKMQGAGKTSFKTEWLSYSFFYVEKVDIHGLKVMAEELPQLQQCFVQTAQATLRLR